MQNIASAKDLVDSSAREQSIQEYPRVLIISPNVLNPVDSGGVLMSNLFAGWPRERLADVYTQDYTPPNWDLCASYYKLLSRISMRPREWIRRAFDYARGVSESFDGVASFRMTRRFEQWLKEFKPQIIYSHLGPLWLTRLTEVVATSLNIPLIIHVMDDYIYDWPVVGIRRRRVFPVANILHYLNCQAFARCIEMARLRFAISPSMADEYYKRYGHHFSVVHNGVNADEWVSRENKVPHADRPFRILYSGGIAENYNLSSLRDISSAVALLGSSGMDVQLEITNPRGPIFRDLLERPPYVRFTEAVSRADFPRRLAEFDLLLIPYNFASGSVRLFRHSWPTKLPEYMASGVPILLYAPAEMGFVEYAARENCAYVVASPDQENIKTAITRLISDVTLRRTLASTAKGIALRDHDMQQIRQKFQAVICQAATAL